MCHNPDLISTRSLKAGALRHRLWRALRAIAESGRSAPSPRLGTESLWDTLRAESACALRLRTIAPCIDNILAVLPNRQTTNYFLLGITYLIPPLAPTVSPL